MRHTRSILPEEPDVIVAGAGLAAGLLALRLSALPQPPRILLLEAGETAFGDKTWSHQATDVSAADRAWLDPAIAKRWTGQSVRFADLTRHLTTGYAAMTSASLRSAVSKQPGVTIRTKARVRAVRPESVLLDDGTRIAAPCIIDSRGHRTAPGLALAYQKFVGLVVETEVPHGVDLPVIMDATVPQIDGFRFVYLLPFSPTRLLIEDTRYADGCALDGDGIEACIRDYAAAKGWRIATVAHREAGVLPIALDFDRRLFWSRAGDVPWLGMRGAFFHATTGYSFPDAVRSANLVAEAWPIRSASLADLVHDHARAREPRQSFYRFLNRMLFRAAQPERRHLVMQKFYRLPQPVIERFYAGRTGLRDMARILSGKPPVPIHRALRSIPPRRLVAEAEL
jgi:lycopene beta-cyclase